MPARSFRRPTRRPSLLRPSRLAVWQLDDRIVPAGTVTGTLFRDFNGDGVYDTTLRTIPNDGGGSVGVSQDVPYSATAVTVRAFDGANQLAGTASPLLSGQYTLNLSGTGPYRIEFSNLPAGFNYGPAGATGVATDQGAGTAVRFVPEGGASGVNLGLVQPGSVAADNPLVATSQFVFGGADQANATQPVVQAFPYSSGRTVGDAVNGDDPSLRGNYGQPQTHAVSIPHGTVGSVWGLGYDGVGRDLLMAAYYKRHSGYGPGGPGAIYTAAPPAGGQTTTASLLLDLNAAADPGNVGGPSAAGTTYRPAVTPAVDYYLTDGLTRVGTGATARDVGWDSVGKEGLGGVDVSADGRFAYTVGLNNRRLYVIDLSSLAVRSYALPTIPGATGADGSDLRPFAVTVHNGQVFVGAVNTAESLYDSSRPTVPAASSADETALNAALAALKGYVFRFDPTGDPVGGGGRFVDAAGAPATAASAANFAFDLNYGRGYAHPGRDFVGNTADDLPAEWRPWSAVYRNVNPLSSQTSPESSYPQPMLTGLAFDADGGLVIGLRDRSGDQFGTFTPADPTNPGLSLYGIPAGDLLRAAAAAGGGWTLESNGTASGTTTGLPAGVAPGSPGAAAVSGVGNGQGPGGGEFYSGDYLVPAADQPHQEVFVGGVLQLPGAPDVATTAYDPAQVQGGFNSGGVRWLFNAGPNAGTVDKAYELYVANFNPPAPGVPFVPPPLFAKSNGIGDLVALNDATLEIGNRVWRDTAPNGIQDAGEPGIGGLTVVLYSGATPIATTTTTADGTYLFSSRPTGPFADRAYGVPLVPGGQYTVRIPLAQAPLAGYQVTTFQAPLPAGASATVQLAEVNSDAQPLAGEAVIAVGALAAAGANHTYDAGFSLIPTLNLGDFVWNDSNNNGLFDSVETGIAGVTVNLLDAAGATVGVQATNAQGGYLFTGLLPGQYRVQIPVGQSALTGLVSSSGVNGSPFGPYEPAGTSAEPTNGPNNSDHGVTRGAFVVGPLVTLALGAAPLLETTVSPNDLGLSDGVVPDASSDRSQDFGFYQPLSLGDRVWVDANNNGSREAAEAALPGVTVQLLDGAGATVGQATTNAQGGYLFTNLSPGDYTVRLVRNGVLDGYASSTGSVRPPVNDRDVGVEETGFITSGAVSLARGGAPAVDPATIPAGLATDPAPAANRYRNVDFGVFQPLSLGDLVWNDLNNDGLRQASEPGIGGVVVTLSSLDDLTAPARTATTQADGGYLFTGLPAGQYRVVISTSSSPALAGMRSSTGTNGSASGPYEPAPASAGNNQDHGSETVGVVFGPVVNLQPGQAPTGEGNAAPSLNDPAADAFSDRTQDFGFFRPLSLGDLVWEDANNNGRRDAGEPGLGGVTVQLRSIDSPAAPTLTATTQADGGYLFTNLTAARYQVVVVTPAGYQTSTGVNGSLTGPFEPPPAPGVNNQDHGTAGPGIAAGPVVNLTVGGAPLGEGNAAPSLTDPSADADSDRTQDFGFYRPLAVGDLVFRDNDTDGVFDAGDVGLAGVTVRLRDAGGAVIGSTTTGADGRYGFSNLAPGTYSVQILPPGGLENTVAAPNPQPANDQNRGVTQADGTIAAAAFTLSAYGDLANPDAAGTANLRQDFGLRVPLPPRPPVSSLGGTVYLDNNLSGTLDDGERGIPDVRVLLDGVTTGGERVSRELFTDGNGRYLFTGLPAGTYVVREQTPTGTLYNGATNVGSQGGTAGLDITTGINLPAGVDAVRYDFGEFQPVSTFGYVWLDDNSNGIFDSGESPIPGVTVTVGGTAFAGSPFARPLTAADVPGGLAAVTGPNGRYDFIPLPPGTYSLTETQPDFFNSGEQNGDPYGPSVGIALNNFSGITLTPTQIRGPFNFGERLGAGEDTPGRSPQVPVDPTKREFLSSTSSTRRAATGSDTGSDQDLQTVSPVARLNLQASPTPLNRSGSIALLATGAAFGASPVVRVFDASAGVERFRFLAYEQNYTGGVATAVGDVDGDGTPDIVTAVAFGGGPRVRVFSGKDASVLQDYFAYESTFTGGLNLAVGDINGDGRADVITGTNMGGGPRVRVFDGATAAVLQDYFAFDQAQRGGVRVAAADFNRDGRDDIAVTTGMGVPTRVRVFDALSTASIIDFSPFEAGFTGGATIAAGDLNGDGVPDLIIGADAGGGPRVTTYSGTDQSILVSFFAFEQTFTGGVRVSAIDADGNGTADIVAAAGTGGTGRVTVYSGPGLGVLQDFFATDVDQPNGVYVGGGAAARKVAATSGTPAAVGALNRAGALTDLPAGFASSVTT